jgi:type IV secretion system protein VirD4
MSATKILWGQVLVVFLIVLAAVWGATQWVAWRLGYQLQLGQPMDVWAGVPVYPPPAFFLWWYWYDAYAPRVFYEGAVIAAAGGFAAIGIAIGMSVWRAREAGDVTTYGSARWATACVLILPRAANTTVARKPGPCFPTSPHGSARDADVVWHRDW